MWLPSGAQYRCVWHAVVMCFVFTVALNIIAVTFKLMKSQQTYTYLNGTGCLIRGQPTSTGSWWTSIRKSVYFLASLTMWGEIGTNVIEEVNIMFGVCSVQW